MEEIELSLRLSLPSIEEEDEPIQVEEIPSPYAAPKTRLIRTFSESMFTLRTPRWSFHPTFLSPISEQDQ